ncbi:MAG: hypothetical protein Q9159_004207 [Coniocarpon cinnabarinum]
MVRAFDMYLEGYQRCHFRGVSSLKNDAFDDHRKQNIMTRALRRLWSLALLLIFFSSHSARAAWGRSNKDVSAVGENEAQQVLNPDEQPSSHLPPGQKQYEDAQAIFDTIRPKPLQALHISKSNGTFGLIWYYVKKAFALLFLSGPKYTVRKPVNPLVFEATGLLIAAAEQGNVDATFALAETAFYGRYDFPRNHTLAYENYKTLAEREGNATAQHMLGFMHATGVGNVLPQDQARALLYHTFAADAGDTKAQMTTAYRHHAGIATPIDCEKSVQYYKQVADKAIEYYRSGPPGGRKLVKESYRVADDEGGVYGDGASFSSAGINARHSMAADSDQNLDNYLEYLDIMARKGDLRAKFRLGQYYYDGSRVLKPDLSAAKDIFLDIARRYWSRDGKIKPDTDRELEKLASKAAAYLGNMFLRGEGMEQNYSKARVWFRRGIDNGDQLCHYSMGLMHLHGLGMEVDAVKASEYFGAAAEHDHPLAQVRLGALMMDQGDVTAAMRYFEVASRHNNIEALYYLAELSNQGLGRDRSCNVAAHYYKNVAERTEALHSNFGEANAFYNSGDIDGALVLYMQAAEQGYEAAQANVAWILDNQSRSYLTPFHALFPSVFQYSAARLSDAAQALTYWTRSAKQANIDSLVKMGDYYISGLGSATSSSSTPHASPQEILSASSFNPEPEKAAACYSAAAETQMSAQAYWNLGWMHENGLGSMAQDFHLAKRYYDHSLETNAEAYLPVTIALFKLRIRSWWNGVSGGKAKGISDPETEKPKRSLSEWLTEFLIAELGALEEEVAQEEARINGEDAGVDEWDATEAIGDEGLYDDLISDQFFEALMFALLAGGLAVLVWYRQLVRQRQQGGGDDSDGQQRRQHEGRDGPASAQEQQRDNGGGGGVNNPMDPAQWAAAGMGQ